MAAQGTGTLKALVSIRSLRVQFTKLTGTIWKRKSVVNAVDNVSFDIYESEILSVVGESGSGKTTIANCVMALMTPNSGSIRYNGIEVITLRGNKLKDYRREVQVIYQDPFESLNPRLDVYSTLSIPIARLTNETHEDKIVEIVRRLLSEVGLNSEETIHKLPHQLSGGERQRINIVRALAPGPKLLIADEPITMLDASQRLNILSLLLELKEKRNLTILLITHDLASAKLMSDRTAVMYSGKLVEIGPTESILSRPHHPYSELILTATPKLTETKEVLASTLSAVSYSSGIEERQSIHNGCVFQPRCKYAKEKCVKEEPQLEEKSSAHYAACHYPLSA